MNSLLARLVGSRWSTHRPAVCSLLEVRSMQPGRDAALPQPMERRWTTPIAGWRRARRRSSPGIFPAMTLPATSASVLLCLIRTELTPCHRLHRAIPGLPLHQPRSAGRQQPCNARPSVLSLFKPRRPISRLSNIASSITDTPVAPKSRPRTCAVMPKCSVHQRYVAYLGEQEEKHGSHRQGWA